MCQQLESTTTTSTANSTMISNTSNILTLEDVIDPRYLGGDSLGMNFYQQPILQQQPGYTTLNYPSLLMTPPSPRVTLDSYLADYHQLQQSSSPQQVCGDGSNTFYQQCFDIYPGLVPPKFNIQNFNPLIQASQISPALFYSSYPTTQPQQPISPHRPINTESAESPPPPADTSPHPITPQPTTFPPEPSRPKVRTRAKKSRSDSSPVRTRPKNIVCPHPGCDKTFSRLYNMRTHLEIHAPIRTKDHPCPECGLPFSRRHDMYRHQRNIHHAKTRSAAPE